MALKHKSIRKPKSKKGILLTLLTVIIFILMLGEVITYVVLNINYDNLSGSVAQSLASGNFAQNLDSGMSAFLYSSLSKSISIITAFESTPTLRNGNFINDSTQTISTLLYNGTLYSNTTEYYNNSFQRAIKEFEAEALTDGFSANLSNITLRIKQSSPFRVGVYVTGLAALNTSSGISLDYPINANTTSSINSKPSLIGAEQGLNGTLQEAQLPKATIVGNITAVSGSTSPYMFAYGKVIYISGEPICSDVATQYANGNYILATPNAADIGQNVCGMAGLITNISNSSTPLKPYLVYKNDSIMSYLQNNPNLLIDGAGLELLNTSAIQSSAVGGFYYPSPYTASYLQRAEAKPYLQSPEGIFSFRSVDRNAAYFNGASSEISMPTTNFPSGANVPFTLEAWVYQNSTSSRHYIIGYGGSSATSQVLMLTNEFTPGQFSLETCGNGWTSNATLVAHKWYNLAISYNGTGSPVFYVNGVKYGISSTWGTPAIDPTSANGIIGNGGACNPSIYMYGDIANAQIYNSSLSSYQISSLYTQGINDIPINGSKLLAWYPLDSNANDYSGNGNNGVPTNVIYSNVNGYTVNPTGQQPMQSIDKAVNVNANIGSSGIYAAKTPLSSLGLNYTVSMWFMLKSNTDPSDGGGANPIIDIYNASTGSGVGGGQNYDFGGAWAGSTAGYFGWGEYWPQDWQFCYTPNGVIRAGVFYNAIVTVHNYTNITVYINGRKENNCKITASLATVKANSQNLVLGVGDNPPGGDEIGNTTVTNVQLYSHTFNQSTVENIYGNGIGSGTNDSSYVVGWWPLGGNANSYAGVSGNGVGVDVNYTPLELPASTSPVKGVLGCDSMSSCNSSSQRLYLSGLPLENAGLGYMNASTSLGMLNGVVPAASQFNGVGYDYAPIGSYFGNNNNLTAEAWVYATPNTNGPIFGVTNVGAASGGWNMPFLSENGLTVHGWIWNVNGNEPLNYTLPTSGWYNLIITYNSTSSTEVFYVDGKNVGTGSGTYSPSGNFDYWTTYISGAKPANVNNILNGTISDVQLYNKFLPSAQAMQLYLNNSVDGFAPADYWPLGEGDGNLLNETENIMNATDYGHLYNSASVACTNSQVINGNCGVSYVPG